MFSVSSSSFLYFASFRWSSPLFKVFSSPRASPFRSVPCQMFSVFSSSCLYLASFRWSSPRFKVFSSPRVFPIRFLSLVKRFQSYLFPSYIFPLRWSSPHFKFFFSSPLVTAGLSLSFRPLSIVSVFFSSLLCLSSFPWSSPRFKIFSCPLVTPLSRSPFSNVFNFPFLRSYILSLFVGAPLVSKSLPLDWSPLQLCSILKFSLLRSCILPLFVGAPLVSKLPRLSCLSCWGCWNY